MGIRFPGNSGLKATILFGNNTLRYAYKCAPMGLKLNGDSKVIKLLNEWIATQANVTTDVPASIEDARKEIEKILIKKKEVVVKRNIDCSTAVIDSRRVANELREVLAGHSIQVLMLLAQRYGLKKDRAITAAFERPDQLAEIREMVETGDAFSEYDDYSHLELLVTEDFIPHKLVYASTYSRFSYPGVEGASVCVQFDEQNKVTNESEIEGKWCICPRNVQKADAYIEQIQNVAVLSPLGILWLVDLGTKMDESNLSTLDIASSIDHDIPIIVVQDRDDGRVRHLGSNFRFSIGLRIVVPVESTSHENQEGGGKDTLGRGEDSIEALEQESRNKPFEFRFCSSTFCTANEDAEE